MIMYLKNKRRIIMINWCGCGNYQICHMCRDNPDGNPEIERKRQIDEAKRIVYEHELKLRREALINEKLLSSYKLLEKYK